MWEKNSLIGQEVQIICIWLGFQIYCSTPPPSPLHIAQSVCLLVDSFMSFGFKSPAEHCFCFHIFQMAKKIIIKYWICMHSRWTIWHNAEAMMETRLAERTTLWCSKSCCSFYLSLLRILFLRSRCASFCRVCPSASLFGGTFSWTSANPQKYFCWSFISDFIPSQTDNFTWELDCRRVFFFFYSNTSYPAGMFVNISINPNSSVNWHYILPSLP